ncbi:MAG: hypothetical protein DMG79_20405 [Acidobacteria bacterium]|nr:MAG: hypothetical protein DMG79_20405 [Acidobacteriota bacterium]
MIWVLAAAISLSLAQQPAKPPTGSASSAAHVTTTAQKTAAASAAISTPAIPSDASSANPANVSREDSDLKMKLTWFTGALTAVAILHSEKWLAV